MPLAMLAIRSGRCRRTWAAERSVLPVSLAATIQITPAGRVYPAYRTPSRAHLVDGLPRRRHVEARPHRHVLPEVEAANRDSTKPCRKRSGGVSGAEAESGEAQRAHISENVDIVDGEHDPQIVCRLAQRSRILRRAGKDLETLLRRSSAGQKDQRCGRSQKHQPQNAQYRSDTQMLSSLHRSLPHAGKGLYRMQKESGVESVL